MTRTASFAAALSILVTSIAGCGGGTRAALDATVFPGDRDVNGRRLENLARTYETQYGCTEADTITINGLAPSVYHVEGCSHIGDYTLFCQMGVGYGRSRRCDWVPFDDLTVRAGADFSCDPSAVDVQVVAAMVRMASGCGYRATYVAQCSGMTCPWVLNSRIEAAPGGAVVGGGGYTY
jgi:hypothetical protein